MFEGRLRRRLRTKLDKPDSPENVRKMNVREMNAREMKVRENNVRENTDAERLA